jgi:FMN phosphatase YigB (HAD superfamily)
VSRIDAVLFDVGGTLWPGRPHPADAAHTAQLSQLGDVLARYGAVDCARFQDRLIARVTEMDDGSFAQTTALAIQDTLEHHGLPAEPDAIEAVRRAMCLPAIDYLTPFPGVAGLLQAVRAIGARCIILSNVTWQNAEDYWRNFWDTGLAWGIDAIVTSLETGFLKPHRAMFEAAVLAAKCEPQQCVMVGNSEEADILPAVALGMRAIRVCIEDPRPNATAAGALADSLLDVATILSEWATSSL